jgi:hypothetical protein
MRAAGVLDLQRTLGNAAATALLTGQDPHPGTRDGVGCAAAAEPSPVDQAGRALQDFEAWADEKKRQNVTDKAAVVGLDPKQAASVPAAAGKIAGYIPTMRRRPPRLTRRSRLSTRR